MCIDVSSNEEHIVKKSLNLYEFYKLYNQIKYSKLIENRMDDQENQPNVEEETLRIDMLDSKLQNENDLNDLGLERKGDWIFLFNKREDSKCENPLYFIKKDMKVHYNALKVHSMH